MKWKRAISQATFILAFPSVRASVYQIRRLPECHKEPCQLHLVTQNSDWQLQLNYSLPHHSGNTISIFLSSCLQSTVHEKSPARNSMSAHAQNIAVSEKLLLAILKASFLQAQNKQQTTYTWHLWNTSTPTVCSTRALTALLDVFSLWSSVWRVNFPPIAAL
jgi:hypothetical protein